MPHVSIRRLLAASLIAAVTSAASAQPDGGRRGPRGFGGPGGGFGLGGLFAMPEVQKELALSEADVAGLTKALEELRPPRGEGGGGGFGDFQDLSQEEREKRMAEFRKQTEEISAKAEAKIKSTLSDAQWKRLNELRLQRDGVGALNRTDVAEKLKLSDEQKDQIKTLFEAYRPQFGRRGGGEGGERPNFEEMQKRWEKLQADLLAVLTPEQKLTWTAMQGSKFTFPERGRGSGREGRPGRGQRPAAE